MAYVWDLLSWKKQAKNLSLVSPSTNDQDCEYPPLKIWTQKKNTNELKQKKLL